jgi:4-hydroxybenzoate polyprenyltransferase
LKALHFIININFVVAFAAVSLAIATEIQLGMQPHPHVYLAVLFFAALLDYNLYRFMYVKKNPESAGIEKYKWAAEHTNFLKLLILISSAGLFTTVFFVKKEIVLLLGLLAGLTFLYSTPVFRKQKSRFRVQEIPGLKILLLALVWAASTVMLPVLNSENLLDYKQILLVFTERFSFIFAIAIPFDIRDRKADTLAGIKTIPVILGEKRALQVCNLALLVSLVTATFHYPLIHFAFIVPAYFVSVILIYIFINSMKIRKLPFYYDGILDGSILLHGILILIGFYFFK